MTQRYLKPAASAQETLASLLDLIPENKRAEATVLAGHIFNYGVRSNPRPANGTCRNNAVSTFLANTPCRVSMNKRTSPSGYSYNAISITYPGKPNLDISENSDDE